MEFEFSKAGIAWKKKQERKKEENKKRISRKKKIRKESIIRYRRQEPILDYMKYWRIVRQWAKVKYKLSQEDLDILFFLYSEQYFDKTKFAEFEQVLPWDKKRFKSLLDREWIHVWRKSGGGNRALYELTIKARFCITTLYKKLNGEDFPISETGNSMFRKDATYTDKVYRKYMLKLRQESQQLRRLAQ
jgi:hypothetical protein|tara:strand:- start:3057 stop:3623 length:567 start_codon:yes stop_codon:yes gene_type:complete